MKFITNMAVAVVLSNLGMQQAVAAQAILRIQVDGYIKEPATWVDENNSPISAMTLSFAGYVKPTPGVDVDSQISRARLINALTYPVSIDLVRPHICSIGNRPVLNNDVFMLIDGTEISQNRAVSIPDRVLTFALRFARRGQYGQLAGAVTCNHRGTLTYTY